MPLTVFIVIYFYLCWNVRRYACMGVWGGGGRGGGGACVCAAGGCTIQCSCCGVTVFESFALSLEVSA